MKRIAVISLTERGRIISENIKSKEQDFLIHRFCFHKHPDANGAVFHDLAELSASLFRAYDALIYICACGIAVRMIAPHIVTKQDDPAVIAVDDRGKFVIPLLSGHLGCANALAERIARALNAVAVITTATDIGGLFSPDSFALANHLLISDLTTAKHIAAAVLNGETVGFHCKYPFRNLPSELTKTDSALLGIVIADTKEFSPYPETLHLIPKNIVVGIGCKKGVAAEIITKTVKEVLSENGISADRICKAASIDRKANEPGLLQFCRESGITLKTYSADTLMQIPGTFTHSEFAKRITGADNICERSAVLCSGGTLIIPKTARNGVTVAAAETSVEIDFEKRIL